MLSILAQAAGDPRIAQIDPEKVLIFGGAFGVAALAIVCGTISTVSRNRQREQSRREIAAYVAEGSISPDDATKLIAAGKSADKCCS